LPGTLIVVCTGLILTAILLYARAIFKQIEKIYRRAFDTNNNLGVKLRCYCTPQHIAL
jgi:hypothetical protein